ncbi:LysM peptidoglycan-binding domain-containing protein [Enterococcus malodoratus]|uniref:LysM peptidoglycan-binding domain-containing protein n=1 Tax=Enterococcus malodoratus TaxID=71451 RepID=UPI0022E88F6B|nr:LysM peptidoglycan-binding domain-containing protein [Enterococcus malodoratus]
MKKIVGVLTLLLLPFLLTACGKNITVDDLKAHNWVTEATNDEPSMIVKFTDHIVSFKVDVDSMKSTASNEWENIGEEIGKSIVDKMEYKYEYTLDKNKLTWIDDEDKNNNAVYDLEKDGNNLVLTPNKDENEKDREKLVLKPYLKKAKVKNSSTTSTKKITKEAVDLNSVVDQFKKDGLEVNNLRKMTKDEYESAPLKAKNGMIFGVQMGSDGEYQNARIFSFGNIDDLNDTKKYYDDLGKESSITFSYTAANEDKLVLMQFNGDLPIEVVDKYVNNADLTLTPVSFDTNSSDSQDMQDESINSSSVETEPEQQPTPQQQPTQQQSEQPSQQADAQQTTTSEDSQNEANAQYGTVQAGEGPKEVAGRYGMSVDDFLQMNGMDQNNYYFNPGQEVRVK